MEEEKSVVEETSAIAGEVVEEVVGEVSMNPEDWEVQTEVATEDITEASDGAEEVVEEVGGDINEAND